VGNQNHHQIIDELNRRVFGLEGKVTALEIMLNQGKEDREEMKNDLKALRATLVRVQIQIASWAGGLGVLYVLFEFVVKHK
jgi:chromosome segregation ATPase